MIITKNDIDVELDNEQESSELLEQAISLLNELETLENSLIGALNRPLYLENEEEREDEIASLEASIDEIEQELEPISKRLDLLN